jgi:hypothetical protein
MIRHAAAVVLALTLNPALVRAQDTVLTVTAGSADVHKGPSTASPVVGSVTRGTVISVSRNLGSWARIAWPDAPDGVGYVHLTMGRLAPSNAGADAPAAVVPPRASSLPAAATTALPLPAAPRPTRGRMAVRDQLTGRTISHIFGVGGLVGSRSSFGATVRAWRNDHLGVQLELTRDAATSDVAAGRVTSIQFQPGVVYALFDHVSDYVWVRPYVGSVLSVRHQTLKVSSPAGMELASSRGLGFRVFAGSELTFAGVPRFGLSAELGYRRLPAPFPGFEADRLSGSLSGHWYIK